MFKKHHTTWLLVSCFYFWRNIKVVSQTTQTHLWLLPWLFSFLPSIEIQCSSSQKPIYSEKLRQPRGCLQLITSGTINNLLFHHCFSGNAKVFVTVIHKNFYFLLEVTSFNKFMQYSIHFILENKIRVENMYINKAVTSKGSQPIKWLKFSI